MLGNVCRLAKESRGWHIKYSGTYKYGQAPFIRGSGWGTGAAPKVVSLRALSKRGFDALRLVAQK
jgi:hypothetical protein